MRGESAGEEIADDAQAGVLAFFRMKLRCKDMLISNDGRECLLPVFARSQIKTFCHRFCVIRMHKIEVVPAYDPLKQRMFFQDLEIVPSHVRDLDVRGPESSDRAFENAEAFYAGSFLAFLEKKLQPQTHSHEFHFLCDEFLQGFDKTAGFELFHGITERAYARENDLPGFPQVATCGAKFVRGLEIFKRLGDAAKISHAVVDNGDHSAVMRAEFGVRREFVFAPNSWLWAHASSELAFSRRNAADARIQADRHIQCFGDAFEHAFDDMMRVLPRQDADVHVDPGMLAEGS